MIANFFLRRAPSISRERVLELAHETLQARNERRAAAAKADLDRRGVAPRVEIGAGYIAPRIARTYTHCSVRGLAG